MSRLPAYCVHKGRHLLYVTLAADSRGATANSRRTAA